MVKEKEWQIGMGMKRDIGSEKEDGFTNESES
jgi:hypothetical protein